MQTLEREAEAFRERCLQADRWLPSARATEFAQWLDGSARKLRTWLAAAPAFEPAAHQTLERLAVWFIQFVEARTEGMRALGEGESSDEILERVFEVWVIFDTAGDPAACEAALIDAGEMRDKHADRAIAATAEAAQPLVADLRAPPALPPLLIAESPAKESNQHQHVGPAQTISILETLIEQEHWPAAVTELSSLRQSAKGDEQRRLEDLEEFAATMAALSEDRSSESHDLVSAARFLGTGGKLAQRLMSKKRLLQASYSLVSEALKHDYGQAQAVAPARPDVNGSWAPIVGRRGEFLRQLGGSSALVKTERVLEQLCSGALATEIVERLWDAVTNLPDAGTARLGLLNFLSKHNLTDQIVVLAGRHDPGIKARLRQLLDLRSFFAVRSDLVPVAQTMAGQIYSTAKSSPFKNFVKDLPVQASISAPELRLKIDPNFLIRLDGAKFRVIEIPIAIEPRGLVPERLEASLFPDDDVTFDDGTRRRILAVEPVYFAEEYSLQLRLGPNWSERIRLSAAATSDDHVPNLRIRISAKALTGELVNADVVVAPALDNADSRGRRIDDETLLEAYPGVEATPAAGEAFVGRQEELERLHDVLISARRPSAVLLTGMRRVGKTSLLFAFHSRSNRPDRFNAVTIYLSLAERRAQLVATDRSVGDVFFGAVAHALGKRHFSASDHNRQIGLRLKEILGEGNAVQLALQDSFDSESLADSLMLLSERILQWLGSTAQRVVYLVDEAETLVLPFQAGGKKKIELEQLLQSLREVCQTSQSVGILLCGSNHIEEFAREYKNAFFGSSVIIKLGGIDDFEEASKIVAPARIRPFLNFQEAAIRQAVSVCNGMPQFMWQLGAAVASLVRSGTITRADVRRGVQALVGDFRVDLPFRAYDVLEPIGHMLGLRGAREQDMLWLALWRVANASSLVAEDAQQHFIIDHTLLELDDNDSWKGRLLSLVELDILEIPRAAAFKFKVPIFGEGFRAPKQQQQYIIRQQRASQA